MNSRLRFALTALLLVGTGLFLNARGHEEVFPLRAPLESLPIQLGEWKGTDDPIPQETLDILGNGDFLSRIYRNPAISQIPVSLFVAYFPSQRAGETIHSPKHCLPGSGWIPVESSRLEISLPGHTPFNVNRYVIARGGSRELVLYWYWAHDRAVASEYAAKFYLVVDSILLKRTDGSLIRLVTPIRHDETTNAAQQRLLAFARHLVWQINLYVPR